uniref:Uncharacterized protein n=1 Tax=Arundo donax TaxID=35708 RepID=A0A0A8ZYX0_ARUDO
MHLTKTKNRGTRKQFQVMKSIVNSA